LETDNSAYFHQVNCHSVLNYLRLSYQLAVIPLRKIFIMYPVEIVQPMKEELTENGFNELLTKDEVEEQLKKQGTTLIMVNSVCGCSAGTARPGVLLAVSNATKKPDHLATSFAGFDVEAVQTLRKHMMPYPPSSPSIALFKNGELVHFIERHQIEGRSAQMIANNLMNAFDQYCN
jgi:putative YphP/YqiW family bacilliredoxin